jgi:hypothetical protein
MKLTNKFCGAGMGVITAALLWSTNLFAATVDMGMDFTFSGTSPGSPTTPWSNARYQDNGDGTVNLTLTNPNLAGTESAKGVYLNFNDSLNVNNLSFSVVNSLTSGSFTLPSSINLSKNGNKADGDGFYDILINFATGTTTSQTFGPGDTLTYKISYTSPISASDFEFKSSMGGGNGSYYAAEQVQNTPNGGGGSAWIGANNFVVMPESSLGIAAGLFLAIGAAGSLLRQTRRQTA